MFLFRKNAHQIEQKELMEIDTVLWFNIAAAPVFLHQGKDWRIFGGYWAGNKRKSHRIMSAYNPNTVRFLQTRRAGKAR